MTMEGRGLLAAPLTGQCLITWGGSAEQVVVLDETINGDFD